MDVDIGHPSPAVFTGLDQDIEGCFVASFVTADGDVFSLDRDEIQWRIRYLQTHEMDSREERKALTSMRVRSASWIAAEEVPA